MKPAPFDYVIPASIEEAVSYLANEDVDTMVLAGGQSLVPLLNMRMARPEMLVDLGKLDGLDFIRETDDGGLAIGAMTTKRSVEHSSLVQNKQPLMHAATCLIAHPQIRNRGTVGGSLAQADPAAEYPAVSLILDARIKAVGPDGERTIPASEFFFTYLTTALQEGELLTEMWLPAFPATRGWAFKEVARRHGDFAMAGSAVTLDLDSSGRCQSTRVVVFALGDTPLRIEKVENAINGQAPSDALFESACLGIAEGVEEPLSDVHASEEYRAELAAVLTRRALREAVDRCGTSA
jgi:CO/xanthine dehydrogenase FAD-binding subunit